MAATGDDGTDMTRVSKLTGLGPAEVGGPSELAEPDPADATQVFRPARPAANGGSEAFMPSAPEPAGASAAFMRPAPEPAAATREPGRPAGAVPIAEHPATTLPGWPVLWGAIALLVVGIALAVKVGSAGGGIGAVLIAIAAVTAGGLTPVAPGEARVVQLLGRYAGTIRAPGLQWVSPVTKRHKISTRIRNHETGLAKVNDEEGNPIEIAAVVVWQVTDTAKAAFGVDNFTSFVAVQTETAVRRVAGSYPYDSHDGKMSLLQNAEEITAALAAEIADRVRPAGVEIIEARLTRLAYAPEIATVMLRRQQAGAVVAARQRIVDGAVGMVEAALERISADGIVELDEERKATMVSNLLVVLCSEHPTQPVINTGTLYQ
jgi:regulator of protease activity HflC (stomatin/prohibitin superfamily)